MKKHCLSGAMVAWVMAVSACSGPTSTPGTRPEPKPGGRILVRTLEPLSANSVSAGERIEVELAEPVVLDGVPRVPESAKAVLHVVDVDQGMRGAGRALLRLRLTQLRPSLLRVLEVHTQAVEFKGTLSNLQAGTTLAFELASPVTTPSRTAARR